MTAAVAKVEIAFVSAPLAAPTWVDVTAYVKAIKTNSGRRRELDPFEVGTASIDLDNTSRRFDPFNAAGPYYGNLLPNKQVRVTSLYSATTYDCWYGYVDGWSQNYDGPSAENTITVNASDAFKILSTSKLPSSVYELEVLADSPVAWYRFEDTSGAQWSDSSGNDNDAPLSNFGGASHRVDNVKRESAMTVDGPASVYLWDPSTLAVLPSACTLPVTQSFEVWQWERSATDRASAMVSGAADSIYVGHWFYGFPHKVCWFSTPDFANGIYTTSDCVVDGKKHHVVLTQSGPTFHIYVDGVDMPLTTLGAGMFPTGSTARTLFYQPTASGLSDVEQWAAGEVGIYSTALSAARVLAHYNAGIAPWQGDTTGARAQRALDRVGWPSARYGLEAGSNSSGVAHLLSQSCLDYLRVVESTEQGQCYVDHRNGGKVTFKGHQSRLTATRSRTSQYTFSDDGTDGSAYRYESIDLQYDDRDIINEVVVEWSQGKATVSDATSQTAYGLRSLPIKTELQTAGEAQALGQWVLSRYKDPKVRCRSIKLAPGSRSDATWLPALEVKIGDRVTVRRLPQNTGAAITKTLIVEGIEHEARDLQWFTTITTSEADASDYWIWGTSTWGTSTRWGY